MDWEKLAYELWRILDDIDTMSDIAKSDNAYYRARTEELQQQRWKHANQDTVDYLYDKYYVSTEEEQNE